MRQKSGKTKAPAASVVRDIRRATRRRFSSEEKIRIVLDGLRGEDSIAGLCRREGIAQSLYYSWSKEFQEAGEDRRHVLATAFDQLFHQSLDSAILVFPHTGSPCLFGRFHG